MRLRPFMWLAPLLAPIAALLPQVAEAHVKWFVDWRRYPTRFDLVPSGRTAAFVAVAAITLAILFLAERLTGDPHWPRLPFFRRMAIGAPTLLAVHAAIALVFVAVQPALVGPHLLLTGSGGFFFAGVQVLVAFSFITGLLDWLGSAVLVALVATVVALFSPMDALDQVLWAGIAAVVLVIGRSTVSAGHARPWFHRRAPNQAWSARAVAALRILAGLALIGPALDEKIWNPQIGAAFLADYPHFNVMRSIFGWDWFSDDLFVLCAGIAEGTIGVALASGLLTRVVILGMWLPFNVTVPFLPPKELLGHLPIFGIMYLLLVHSSGIGMGESAEHESTPPGLPRDLSRESAAAR